MVFCVAAPPAPRSAAHPWCQLPPRCHALPTSATARRSVPTTTKTPVARVPVHTFCMAESGFSPAGHRLHNKVGATGGDRQELVRHSGTQHMGAKTWMLVYADGNAREALRAYPTLDRDATRQLAEKLFGGEKLTYEEDCDLTYTCPADDELCIGCFPGVSVIAAKEFGIDYPSKLPQSFINAGGNGTIYLHAMHSVVDWFAFAVWSNRRLIRSLSLSPDSGVAEDIGQRLPFELPYWSGQHPAVDGDEDSYPFVFHPLELGEAALETFFGYCLEGPIDSDQFEPERIPLIQYKRARKRWKFWR